MDLVWQKADDLTGNVQPKEVFANILLDAKTPIIFKNTGEHWTRSFLERTDYTTMFSYLSKKLEIASGANVRCLAWSGMDSYLACGCDNGLLKVLKIDSTSGGGNESSSNPKGYLAIPTNITMNQTLEGHSSQIQVISWNNVHNKLTTSDSKGLIVVWMLYKGSWYEEMVNNRNKSTVRGLAWSSDGEKICIVYEDGGVIVGSADGNRLWSKELMGPGLTGVSWSPDANQLLFTVGTSEVHVYDSNGSFSSKLAVGYKGSSSSNSSNIVAVRWRQQITLGEVEFPNLIVVFEKSSLNLMKGINDENPLVLEYNLAPSCAEWSTNGMYFAVGGALVKQRGLDADLEQVLIYSAFGRFLHQVRVPTKNIMSIAWDAWSIKLAIGAGPHIYFANVRPFYKIAHYAERMFVYAFNRSDGSQHLGFWDDEKLNTQEIPGKVIEVKGNSDFLAVMTLSYTGMYNVAIVNSVGAPVDSLSIVTIEPYTMCLTPTNVICLAMNAVLIWKYNVTVSKKGAIGIASKRRERAFHIDETPTVLGDTTESDQLKEPVDYLKKPTKDPTVAVDAVLHILAVMRESGKFNLYSLPHGAFISTLNTAADLGLRPIRIFLNCDGTQMAMLDTYGVVSLCSVTSAGMRSGGTATSAISQLDRKDVWDLMWAKDNPNLMSVMEKTRLYIYQNGVPEEPALSSGYFLDFKDLRVTSVLMDELMQDPERVTQNTFVHFDTRTLRNMQAMMDSETPLKDILDFVEENPHPHLYHLLAHSALTSLDFDVAEAAFVRSKDYAGIQFVKRVSNIQNELVQQAEVAAFFEDFNKAEDLYIEADRRDLAVEMWRLLGDWNKIEELSFPRQRPSDKIIRTMNLARGDFYAEKLDWAKAKAHYEKAEDMDQLFLSSLILEDFTYLQTMVQTLPDEHPLISKIAAVFASLGRCQESVNMYLKCGRHEKAVDVAIKLNQWTLAMDLARRYSVGNAGKVLLRYARYLIKQQKLMQVVQLFKTSNYNLMASKILVMTALRELDEITLDAPYVKKLFVSSGLMSIEDRPKVDYLQSRESRLSLRSAEAENDDVIGEMQFEKYIPKAFQPSREICAWMLNNPWRGAEALHFYILCQKLLYTRRFDRAARCAMQLMAYDDILGDERVAAMIALTTANTGAFKACSRALTTLEAIDSEYADLGQSLFSETPPFDEKPMTVECDKCLAVIPDSATKCTSCKATFPICTFTGRPLNYRLKGGIWTCRVCNHSADAEEVRDYPSCPLCGVPKLGTTTIPQSRKTKESVHAKAIPNSDLNFDSD